MDRVVDGLMKEQKFTEAVKKLKDAQILLDGPLFIIEGLAQLKIKIVDLRQVSDKASVLIYIFPSFIGHLANNNRKYAPMADR